MKFIIVTTGKIKEDFILKGVKEYRDRIDRYAHLAFLPVKEERLVKGLSEPMVLQKEGVRILNKIPHDGLWIALERRGQEMNSRQHFDFLDTQARNRGKKDLLFNRRSHRAFSRGSQSIRPAPFPFADDPDP